MNYRKQNMADFEAVCAETWSQFQEFGKVEILPNRLFCSGLVIDSRDKFLEYKAVMFKFYKGIE